MISTLNSHVIISFVKHHEEINNRTRIRYKQNNIRLKYKMNIICTEFVSIRTSFVVSLHSSPCPKERVLWSILQWISSQFFTVSLMLTRNKKRETDWIEIRIELRKVGPITHSFIEEIFRCKIKRMKIKMSSSISPKPVNWLHIQLWLSYAYCKLMMKMEKVNFSNCDK